ncbi:hypothetical protein 10S1_53 [uncultured Caudovirales phage]|uniref:Uncharacterized protein n=1 Tax=uncultured Caudovirales phage TaxID=2100421 RepID=A0A2H4JDA6_9CAUD|nr:hypothetical protein 10S1_53 [uncultured Caudovirales phage]
MAYEFESKLYANSVVHSITENVFIETGETKELKEVYKKAKAFDNYMVDLVKTVELYPHDYIKNSNFAKETYEFYMKSKEDFIKAYENEVGRKHELIHDIAEYDRILSDLEDE